MAPIKSKTNKKVTAVHSTNQKNSLKLSATNKKHDDMFDVRESLMVTTETTDDIVLNKSTPTRASTKVSSSLIRFFYNIDMCVFRII